MRKSLVTALISCADGPNRSQALRFVEGLSADELQFIAGFLGSCVLDATGKPCMSRNQWAERIAHYCAASAGCDNRRAPDEDHKMILLLEFLCRSGAPPAVFSARA